MRRLAISGRYTGWVVLMLLAPGCASKTPEGGAPTGIENSVHRLTSGSGTLAYFAGLPDGIGSADGVGAAARFWNPMGVAVDGSGNVYVADYQASTIRKITPSGAVSTLAGSPGQQGSTDATGANARFAGPTGVAVDGSGNVYVADQGNHTIRKITPAGAVSTLAGSPGQSGTTNATGADARFLAPFGVAVDGSGNVYVGDTGNHTIRKITPAGAVSTLAGFPGEGGSANGTGAGARFSSPQGVAVYGSGNVYVADTGNHTIRMVTPTGDVTTLAGSAGQMGSAEGSGADARFSGPFAVTVDGSGNVYVGDTGNNTIRVITPAGVVSTLAGSAGQRGDGNGTGAGARFDGPQGVAVDGSGNVYVGDYGNNDIRKISSTGVVIRLAGDGPGRAGMTNATGTAARFSGPSGVAVDGSGNSYVADTWNHIIRKITPAGVVSTLAGSPGEFGSADGTGADARFRGPQSVAVDGSGNVYVADTYNFTIRKILPSGEVSTLAGLAGQPGSANGTGAEARFQLPLGVAVDGSANVYVADHSNCVIRRITPAGVVTTLAGLNGFSGSADGTGADARFSFPYAVAADAAGNVFVADTSNHTIRRITPAGEVTTLAGAPGQTGAVDGTGASARFHYPFGIAVDGTGHVYVADYSNNAIRGVSPAGVVSTVVGILASFPPGNIPGPLPASINLPTGVAVDPVSGSLFLALDSAILVASNTLAVSPTTATVAPAGQQTFTASGGTGVYAWSLSSNNSGGAITSTGVYTAGTTGGVTDTVSVTDSNGATATATVAVTAPPSQDAGACQCSGTGPGDTPVTVNCGQSACGSNFLSYSCSADGWSLTGQACTGNNDAGGGSCQCSGTGPGNTPVTVNCGQSACGANFLTYSCAADGWSFAGQACTGNNDAGGGPCQCSGTGPGGTPVTVSCGQSACGSNFLTYACAADGWSLTGQVCTGSSDAGTGPCQCTGTGPGDTPVTVDCGQSACGSDFMTYSCGAAGWSSTGQACSAGGGASCPCTGAGPGGVPLTAGCGVTACGSDYHTYLCNTSGWNYVGQTCTEGCSCSGTGPGGAPVTAVCGQSACGSDSMTYSCSLSGWSPTGTACP